MKKKFSLFCFNILICIEKLFLLLTKKSVMMWLMNKIQENSYTSMIITKKNIKFFVPNSITKWRVKSFFLKEPETLEWIDGFENKENLIFWDIGANIGLYSIYNSLKNANSTTVAFEPSSSNLRVLSRNISINNLKNIKIIPMPLTNKKKFFQEMNEGSFVEGGALNSYGEEFNFEGKKIETKNKYTLLGTTINFLIENSILEIPDYIKIDVDGIEHLILEGGNKYLNNKKIKSLSIEINENFKEQHNQVLSLMNDYEFKILHKKNNKNMFPKDSRFWKTYNYVFVRK
jgi:FkbM family methyltransferase